MNDRGEFESVLAEVFAAYDRPMTEAKVNAFWKSLQPMSFSEFSRSRDLLLHELETSPPPKTFTPNTFWEAKRRLRASAPLERPVDDWVGDQWDIAANRHLLGFLTRQRPKLPGKPPTLHGMRTMTTPNADASPEFVAAVGLLVRYKHAWAQDMREEAVDGEVPAERQRTTWDQCMTRAIAEINA